MCPFPIHVYVCVACVFVDCYPLLCSNLIDCNSRAGCRFCPTNWKECNASSQCMPASDCPPRPCGKCYYMPKLFTFGLVYVLHLEELHGMLHVFHCVTIVAGGSGRLFGRHSQLSAGEA